MLPIDLIKRFNNTFALCLLILLTTPVYAKTLDNSHAISAVLQSFKLAIQNKDQALFMTLFHDENVSWVGVISNKTREDLIAKNEKFKQKSKIINSTPEKFISNIVKSPQISKETFNNIKITEDNEVAAVSFDYEFFKDDKLTNYGQEHWQLINTKNGWKINAVNFSFTLAP
tara:strand:+ start:1776 stop:2291 length:516 start_codon:yes stop_codon:yes gene_type:complete